MKSIVYQSYRTHQVPDWITTCMQTVRAWADANAFEYRFIDDSFLAYAPDWFRAKTDGSVCPSTDLARLLVARELLAEGYERAIWVDADMLIFAPEKLTLELSKDFAFCHEIWLFTDDAGESQISHRVNNSISVFCRNNVHLDFFIDAALRIAQHRQRIGKLDIGTIFLSQLRSILPYPLLENVGILGPELMREISLEQARQLIDYARCLKSPLACANLCASLHGQAIQDITLEHSLYEDVVRHLLASRGEVINRFYIAPA
jgi:hypothetical protein